MIFFLYEKFILCLYGIQIIPFPSMTKLQIKLDYYLKKNNSTFFLQNLIISTTEKRNVSTCHIVYKTSDNSRVPLIFQDDESCLGRSIERDTIFFYLFKQKIYTLYSTSIYFLQ